MNRALTEKRTPEQNRKIWALAGELGFDETLLRDLVQRISGQRSTSSLTIMQANELIEEMNRLSGKQPTRAANVRRPGMATPEQINKIRSLEKQLGWADDPRRLQGFMKRFSNGIVRLEWLTASQASRLIESLKGMKGTLERQQTRKGGQAGGAAHEPVHAGPAEMD